MHYSRLFWREIEGILITVDFFEEILEKILKEVHSS